MSNIGMLHFKVGSTDGVSLEMDKWKLILEEMGHTVHYAAGDLGALEKVRLSKKCTIIASTLANCMTIPLLPSLIMMLPVMKRRLMIW
ncbi:MAG: hypothetical protein M5U34_09740 [Chloroflexi bacterium]|nr:hypothetical protein [Chloroflexota bacterium]